MESPAVVVYLLSLAVLLSAVAGVTWRLLRRGRGAAASQGAPPGSEQRYRNLVEHTHDMVVEYDEACRVLYVSPQYEILVGRDPAEAVGRHVCEDVHADDRELAAAELRQTWSRGFGHVAYRHRHRSGEWRWLESSTRSFVTPEGARHGVMLSRDITQSKLAEEALRRSEAKTRAILAALPDLVLQVDRNGVLLGVSAPEDAVLLAPPSELQGRTLEEVLPPVLASMTRERLAATLAGRETQTYDYSLPVLGGTRWFEARMVPFSADAVVAVVRDITTRKGAEEALRDSEAKYKSLTEEIPVGIYRTDPVGRVRHANPALATILGFASAAEVVQSCDVRSCFANPAVRSELLERWKRRGGVGKEEMLLLRRDGTPIWVRDSYRVTLGPEGEIDHLDGVLEDITERKQAEEALRASEVRYRQIFEASRAPMLLIDPATATVVDANPAASTLYGYSLEQLKGLELGALDVQSGLARPEGLAGLAELPAATFQTEHRLASGESCQVEVHVSTVEIAGRRLLFSIVHDVTLRLQAEAERDRVNRLLKTTAGIASQFLTTPDPREAASRVVETLGQEVDVDRCYWFEAFTDEQGDLLVRLMGEWRRSGISSVLELPALHALPAASFPRLQRALQSGDVISGVVADFPPEEQALFAMGGTRAVVLVPFIIRESATGFLGFDLCTRVRVWQPDEVHLMRAAATTFAMALERREQQQQRDELASVVEQASEAVIITDRRWRIRYVNPAYTRITGFGREESLGRRPWMLMLKGLPNPLPPEAMEGPERGESWSGILESWRKDQVLLQTQSTVFPLRGDGGAILGFGSIHVDVTSQLRLEGQLRRAQRMEALGQFASGIAHDFNNLITVIQGASGLLARRASEGAALDEELATIRDAAQRSSALTGSLLAFARRQMLRREEVDLNAAIGTALPMLRHLLPETITLVYAPTDATPGVSADLGQLDQVLMNLVANARDAMPGGGTLTLATEIVELGPDYTATHPWAREGRYVRLAVTDTGDGMDEATLLRIFEPFFTTKEPGKGTGLGLSSVLGIIKQHGGVIDVESVPGVGSTFNLYLPRLDHEVEPGVSQPEALEARGGHERVLVVEDQNDLRKVLKGIMQDLGYQVRVARDGVEALALLEETGGGFDLVISDLVMPRLNGVELLRRCREAYPRIAFLLQSGDADAGGDEAVLDSPRVGYVSKPYSLELLAHHVRTLLDAPAEQSSPTRPRRYVRPACRP